MCRSESNTREAKKGREIEIKRERRHVHNCHEPLE